MVKVLKRVKPCVPKLNITVKSFGLGQKTEEIGNDEEKGGADTEKTKSEEENKKKKEEADTEKTKTKEKHLKKKKEEPEMKSLLEIEEWNRALRSEEELPPYSETISRDSIY